MLGMVGRGEWLQSGWSKSTNGLEYQRKVFELNFTDTEEARELF